MEYVFLDRLSASIACFKSKKVLSAANPNTFGHGFEKHYLSQIYRIPHQWGICVNIELYSSEKSAVVPSMLWWNYPGIRAMVL